MVRANERRGVVFVDARSIRLLINKVNQDNIQQMTNMVLNKLEETIPIKHCMNQGSKAEKEKLHKLGKHCQPPANKWGLQKVIRGVSHLVVHPFEFP